MASDKTRAVHLPNTFSIRQPFALLISLLFCGAATAQTETPATVPEALVGTYTLSYDLINTGGPFSAGQEVTLVIAADNTLCISGQSLGNPVFRSGNQVEGIWKDESSGFELAVSSFSGGAFNEVNVTGPNFSPFYGQLSGSKTSDATTCGSGSDSGNGNSDGGATPEVTANMNAIFAAAESKLAAIFPPGQQTRFQDQYVYRYYPSSGVYLAFADNSVYLLGGQFGGAIVNAGSIQFVLDTLESYPNPGTGTGGGSVDLWDLTISGTFDTDFVQNLSFSGITLADVPAPDLSNTEAINQEILTTLEGVASGISSISINVVENSANRRAFDVTFSATTQAGSVSYNLSYVYTR